MFAAFTPPAHQAVVRSGRLAADAGRRLLSTDFLLLGLTEVHDLDPPLERLGITAAAVRAHIDQQHGGAPPGDRELLASLGIELDEVRRRAGLAISTSPDDPNLWRLCRSRVHPLRVELVGPASHLQLDGRGRKVIEVAMHYAHRRHALVSGEDCWWDCWPTGPTSRSASCAASASTLASSGRTCAAGTWQQPEAASRWAAHVAGPGHQPPASLSRQARPGFDCHGRIAPPYAQLPRWRP
jgi:hypothetical protein